MFTQRDITKLEGIELAINEQHFIQLRSQMKLLSIEGKSKVHRDQRICSQIIISEFEKNPQLLMVMAVGKTQSGKTGVMYSCIQEFTEPDHISGNHVPVQNIYLITGLSSTQWKDQTKDRIPGILSENIFHRPELKTKFMESIRGKKNILILMDEVQIACGKTQTLAKEFEEMGLLDIQFLMKYDIKIVEFSATPNGTLRDCKYWVEHSKIVKVNPGKGYVGCSELLSNERIRDCKDLCESDEARKNILDIKALIDEKFKRPLYHIIRTKTGQFQLITISMFKEVFGDDCNYLHHDSENISSLDEFLGEGDKEPPPPPPPKHTFIFLKEMARCAKTFKKDLIGIWYERYSNNMRDDIVIQGLLGRATGYDDNGISIVFTNTDSIKRYDELWDKDFSEDVEWLSNTTSFSKKKKKTIAKKTFNGKVTNDGGQMFEEEKPGGVMTYDNSGQGYTNPNDLINEMKDYLEKPRGITIKASKPRPGGTKFFISSTDVGSTEKAMLEENRLLFKNLYSKLNNKTNLDAESRAWMIYPVYMDEHARPEQVIWFGKCLMKV